MLAFALLNRWSALGDSGYFNDELFYFAAGQHLHDRLLPYVDIWDRKGPGLFLTYYLFAWLGDGPLAYQLPALVFAVATAWCIRCIALQFTSRTGALAGASLYLAAMPVFGGGSGQTPVFYNLWMALAALLVLRATPALRQGQVGWQALGAMASAGFAITYKQTALFEAAFLGLWAVWQLRSSGRNPLPGTLQLAFAGMAPFGAFALAYLALGHFHEFSDAMINANLRKTNDPTGNQLSRAWAMAWMGWPMLLAGLAGLALRHQGAGWNPRGFLLGWVLAAMVGVASVPNYYEHYILPLLVPLCVAATRAFWHELRGIVWAALASIYCFAVGPAFFISDRDRSRAEMAALEADIRARDSQPRLFVYQGPMSLYGRFRSYPPSPLLDNFHLYFPPENNVSLFDTRTEVQRILAWQPTVVIVFNNWPSIEENQRTAPLVRRYAAENCQLWFVRPFREVFRTYELAVYGDCKAR